jgi:putative iron-dependent peroxidase
MPEAHSASPQPVTAPRTRDAIFVVVSVEDRPSALEAVRRACAAVAGLVRAIGTRDPDARLTCVIGIGSDFWDRLVGGPRPAGLHPFAEVRRGPSHAVSTPGDLLFHIQAERQDLCFELASQFMHILGSAVRVEDEIHGFRYFDDRDLTGFVDGTENPVGQDALDATIIGDEDPAFAGGSYVLVQKYLHQLSSWDALPTEAQELIIGRRKLSDIELDDATKPPWAHNALTNIVEDGVEQKILRHNMPFGNAGGGDAGTYFIGYARSPRPLETMITHMFIGDPPGVYDRLLDFTKAVTGTLFFVPSLAALEAIGG